MNKSKQNLKLKLKLKLKVKMTAGQLPFPYNGNYTGFAYIRVFGEAAPVPFTYYANHNVPAEIVTDGYDF